MGYVDDIYTELDTAGVIPTGWTLRKRFMSPTPNKLVCITEDGGNPPERLAAQGIGDVAFEEPAAQVRVRGDARQAEDAFNLANDIKQHLHGIANTTVGYTIYHRIRADLPEPLLAFWDDDARPNYTLTYRGFRNVVGTS